MRRQQGGLNGPNIIDAENWSMEDEEGWRIYNTNSSSQERKERWSKRSKRSKHNKQGDIKTLLSKTSIKAMAIWILTSIIMVIIFNISIVGYLGQETLKIIILISLFIIVIIMFLEKGAKKKLWMAVNAFCAWLITSSIVTIILPQIFGLKMSVLNAVDVLKVLLALIAISSVYVNYKTRRRIQLTMLGTSLLLSTVVITKNGIGMTVIFIGISCVSICWEYKKCDTYKKKHPFD